MRVVEVLGHGCQKCQYLEQLVRDVAAGEGLEADVRHVTDEAEIVSRGVMSTPGLAVDGRVVSMGRIPTREQVAAWLRTA
jgi:small redox-active disulfide protein 2